MFDKTYVNVPDEIKISKMPELEIKVKQQEMVTISLEEYEKLKSDIEILKRQKSELTTFRNNVLKPFMNPHSLPEETVPEDVLKKMFENKFKTKVVFQNGPIDPFTIRLGVLYTIDDYEFCRDRVLKR